MYKYYSLERPVSLGTFPKTKELIGFENFEENNQCVKRMVTDNDKVFKAWGYLLFSKPLTSKELEDYELGDAGVVNRLTKIETLPINLQETLRAEINKFYEKNNPDFRMSRDSFVSFYGTFTLGDFHKMLPNIANKYCFLNEKSKSPLEKLMDGNTKYESILDTMTAKESDDIEIDI